MTSTLLFSLLFGLSFSPVVTVAVPEGSNGGPCIPDAICTDNNAVCNQDTICTCAQGYVNVNGTCRMQGNNGGPCLPGAVCNDDNAVCNQDTICTCTQGYLNVNRTCRMEGYNGGPCLPDAMCNDDNAVCNQDTICTCAQGYVNVNGTCRMEDPSSTTTATGENPSPCSVTCGNGGSCNLDDTTGNYRCFCQRGFAGSACQFDDPCISSPCPSNAECRINDVGERICLCPPNVQDPECTVDNGGTSVPPDGSTTTDGGTTTPDGIGACNIACLNGGTCVLDGAPGSYRCDCPEGFTGLTCETNVDYCASSPCPNGATCLAKPSNKLGYVCACPGDFKGPECTEVDNLVICKDFEKLLYLEQQPTPEERAICVPKTGSTPNGICFDATEELIYYISGMDDTLIRIDDLEDQYCAEYYVDDATAAKYCTKITAHEADDIQIRPWRNANATVCFVFNRKPEFVAPHEVRYNLPDMAESEIVDLNATDPDGHQQLIFQIIDVTPQVYLNWFSVSSSGQLQTIKPAAIPNDPLDIDVLFRIEDNGIPTLGLEKIVKVKFTDKQLLCGTNEDPIYVHLDVTSLPMEIGSITCDSEDPNIVFSMQNDGDLSSAFSVEQTGVLYLNEYLQSGNYQIMVKAEVSEPIRVATEVPVQVVIGNMLPDCSSSSEPFNVSENAPNGACWNNTYVCSNPSGKPVDCIDGGSELFEIECVPVHKSIRIKLCSVDILKGEVGLHMLNVTLSNVYGETALSMETIIENVNDRPDILADHNSVQEYSVDESFMIGDRIASITVSDPDLFVDIDPPEQLTAEITARPNATGSPQTYPFEASLNTQQNFIAITLSEQLDVTIAQRYTFSVKVTDRGGLSDTVLATLTVDDVNGPPVCEPDNYNGITVSVKDTINKVVVRLNCTDRDIKPEFKNLIYEIQGDQVVKDHFSVDVNGVVTLTKSLTGVTETTLVITVDVSDGAKASTQVTITVLVSSDFPPECSKPVITTSKSEDTAANVCFTVDSGCIEPVNSLPLQFEIDSGNGTQLFRLNADQQENNNIGLCTDTTLRNKYGTWILSGRAVSGFGATPITIVISVSDINDPPSFEKNVYRESVVENSGIGSTVIAVNATDPDSGVFGQVTYISEGIESSPMFTINKNTGLITVSGAIDADIEGSTEYTFNVKAIDGGPPHVPVVTTDVIISVTDINDNAPKCEQPQSIPLYLLTPVKAVVYTLTCSDIDKSPEFRRFRYEILSSDTDSVSETFSIDGNGVMRLEKALSRDIQGYDIPVVVHDSDDEKTANSIHVDLRFAVNTTVPPRCTPTIITDSLQETKPITFCINNQVECVDITGGDTITLTSTAGNGSNILEIRRRSEANTLFLSACIKTSIKDKFGTYQIEAIVSNGLAETKVIWKFTITNVNEPPSFSLPLYEAKIPENFKPGQILLELDVTDPDENTSEESFHISKVEAESVNDEEFGGALSDYIKYFNTSREFYVVVNGLNATKRNKYLYQVTAEDGMGLRATSSVAINITDVNEQPICTDSQVSASTDILEAVGENVGRVECYDTDLDPRNTELLYSITNGDPDGYFNMTSNGFIFIAKKLPRLRLYNTGRVDLTIKVEDRGDPPLSTSVTASVSVNNRIPPTCNPIITPPVQWVKDECLTVTMDCSDPTFPGSTGHMAYTLSGNYSAGFRTPGIIGDVFKLCYNRTDSGYFEIRVEVGNGLKETLFKEVVQVKYLEATPVFNQSSFKAHVSEFTVAKEEILTAEATSSNVNSTLVYAVVAAESTSGWSDYFSLDSTSGTVTTKKELKDLADTVMQLKIEVQDQYSKLKSSALVEITIEDINEVPSCDITDTDINIDVDTDVEQAIKQFSCSDPDVVADYKRLSYVLTGSTNVNIYFKLIPENEPTSIALKEPLSVTLSSYDSRVDIARSAYHVTLEVSDSGDPAQVYRKQLKIIVSLLPPAVEWEIFDLGYSHVFVTWKYTRNDYYQVTTSFQVKLKKPNSDDFVETEVLKPDKRYYNATALDPKTEYELSISAGTPYGTRNTSSQTIMTAEIPKIKIIVAAIKYVDLVYDELLRDPNTPLYAEMSKNVIDSIYFVLKVLSGIVGVAVKSYRPGSLIVTAVISVNQSGNAENTKTLLADSVNSGYLGQHAVDKNSFVANIGGGYIMVDKIEVGSDNVYNGTDIIMNCFVTTAGYKLDAQFQFWWTYNGTLVQPNSVSRRSTVSFAGAIFPELYMSILEIKTATARDSGSYECFVSDAVRASSSSKKIYIDVLSQPVVTLTPRSLTVDSGSAVTMVCTLVRPLDETESFQFLWYRNGSLLEIKQVEDYNENETTGILTISSMTVTTKFGCRGRNVAGDGPLVQSNIGVIPTGPRVTLCPETTDNRATVWYETLPGTVAIGPCPVGSTGESTRKCGEDGKWDPPWYQCVKNTIRGFQQQVNDVKDGSGTTTLTDSLKGLGNATDDETLFEGDLTAVVDILEDTIIASNTTRQPETEPEQIDEINSYLKVCSDLVDERNIEPWGMNIENTGKGANEVTRFVQEYIDVKSNQLSAETNEPFDKVFEQKNIYAVIVKRPGKAITFPDSTKTVPLWIETSGTSVYVSEETLKDLPVVVYDGTYYRNLSTMVVKKLKQDGNIRDFANIYAFNAAIVGFKVQGLTIDLDPPAVINFKLEDTNYSKPICVFWDRLDKAWSTEGCYLADFSVEDVVTCKCSHFTNFAVLMSPGKTPAADLLALSIISAVGCAISMFCLLVTVVIHVVVWRIVKSDRAIILLNLCIALLIGYALFLGGIGQADKEDLCTAIAALLHYIFLVVFFLMLAEGIDIAVSILYVFATKSRIKWLIPLAWFIPAVIVAISLGVTQTEGYGNETFCWLSTKSGLLYAFVGPAAFVILVNLIIIIIVFRQMFTSSAMLTKSDKQKAKTSLRSLCVLLPIMGLTWVFGVFSVNEDLVAFQYIFAICNSLQGFFIFLFHCFLNKQLRDALKQRRARKKSLQSFEKSYKNQHSTGTGSTTFHTSEDKDKEINNDPAIKSSSSNPFLEADRQMKEMVSKGKKTGNTFDKEANNKLKVDKDKPTVDVALEDVKISNILRESEVMSGTAGISSILTTQPDAERRPRDNERPEDDKNKIRESKASSHAYDYVLDSSYKTGGAQQRPAGYEKLFNPQTRSTGYDRIVRSDDNVSGLYSGGKDSASRGRVMTDSRERIDDGRERSASSGRSDDDYEERLRERQQRLNTVYMPYDRSAHASQEVGASLPKKYDPKQAKQAELPKKGMLSGKPKATEGGAVKKLSSKKKKEKEKDRSRIYQYQYPYEATYLGQQQESRHSSLENMSAHYVNPEYNPYAGMHPQGHTGRPTHQQQWNPYAWGNQQRRDYW